MATEKWNRATLRISSDKLSLEEITARLVVKPTESCRRGELMSRRNPRSKRFQENLWMLESPLEEDIKLAKKILGLLDFLDSKAAAVELLRADCEIDIFCGIMCGSQGALHLTHELLARAARFPIDLVFDLYAIGMKTDE
jgi:hypothetical protein